MKNALKLIFAFLIFLQSNDIQAQQLLGSGVPVKKRFGVGESYFYAGDRIKVEFTGVEKKMEYLFEGPSIAFLADYWANFKNVENIEKEEWVVTKSGPHKISFYKVKGSGEFKIYRYPAAGNENLPTTFSTRYNVEYSEMETKSKRFAKAYSKATKSKSYVVGMPDHFLNKKIQEFDLKKGLVVYDNDVEIVNGNNQLVDRILNFQQSYRFQKGDTVAFEFTFSKKAKGIESQNGTHAGVIQADVMESFNPGSFPFWAMTGATPNISDILKLGQSFSGSFVLTNDGVYTFFMQHDATYNLKIVRFPGTGGDRAFNTTVEMIPVWQGDEAAYFSLEPKLD